MRRPTGRLHPEPGPAAFRPSELEAQIARRCGGAERADFVDATGLATALMGDSIATNMFMLGFAYQKGLVPVSAEAIDQAIELNGAAVDDEHGGLPLGPPRRRRSGRRSRRAAATSEPRPAATLSQTLDEMIARRVEFLTAYQNAAYAARYKSWSMRVRQVEGERARGRTG